LTDVYLESGARRVFACALDWPGWARSGKDERTALEALAAAAPRYAAVAKAARVPFPTAAGSSLKVVERPAGNASTDFGVPGAIASRDRKPTTAADAKRIAALVAASWKVLERTVAGAPASLRKGPRGGGRDRDAIVAHVVSAESHYYTRALGLRYPELHPGDRREVKAMRDAILEVLSAPSKGKPLAEKGWPQRYAARRIAWHALDHAWEIEDRGA